MYSINSGAVFWGFCSESSATFEAGSSERISPPLSTMAPFVRCQSGFASCACCAENTNYGEMTIDRMLEKELCDKIVAKLSARPREKSDNQRAARLII